MADTSRELREQLRAELAKILNEIALATRQAEALVNRIAQIDRENGDEPEPEPGSFRPQPSGPPPFKFGDPGDEASEDSSSQ